MAEREANLPVDFFEIGPQDEQLSSVELGSLSLLEGLKKVPSFYKFPGSTVLRKCSPGQIMCRQGEAGASAFYILSPHDVVALRRQQLTFIEKALRGGDAADVPAPFGNLSQSALQSLQQRFEKEVLAFSKRQAELEQATDPALH